MKRRWKRERCASIQNVSIGRLKIGRNGQNGMFLNIVLFFAILVHYYVNRNCSIQFILVSNTYLM